MNEDGREGDDSWNAKGNKKGVGWPDYFAWMVKIAEKYVGQNDAKDVANAALYDFCCSDRPRPAADNRQETEYLLRHLVKQRARALWKQKKRRQPEVLSSFDHDEPHSEFDQANHDDRVVDRLELERVLAELSTVERQLVVGFYVDGLTARELAREHKMKANTVNSQLRRMLPRMARTLSDYSRHVRRSSGILFFVAWKKEQLRKVYSAWSFIRENLASGSNLMRVMRGLAYCAPLAILPGHVQAADVPEDPPHKPENPIPRVTSDWPFRFVGVEFNLTIARLEETKPEIPTLGPSKRTNPAAKPNLPAQGTEKPTSENEKPPLRERVEALPVNDCHNQLGLALAKKNVQEFQECLELLERVRRNDVACGQTFDWKVLKAQCSRP